MSGARFGGMTRLRRLAAVVLARDLTTYVVPGLEIARAHGLDLVAAGLRPVPTPRQAGVLLIIGDLPPGLARAAAVVYAQMPRPRAILAVGVEGGAPLPAPDIAVPLAQDALERGVADLRRRIADGAFSLTALAFAADAVRTETEYTCPMHPEIVRDGPGKCPICGMDLVKRERLGESAAHATLAVGQEARAAAGGLADGVYTCPMHPEIARGAPGACPLCGMALVLHEAAPAGARPDDIAAQAGGGDAGNYSCPMHPEIIRNTPGSCPLCEMDLVPREGQDEGAPLPATNAPTSGYTCPMHPEIVRDEPGSCPICGMDMVPRDGTGTESGHHAAGATTAMPITGAAHDAHTAHDTTDQGVMPTHGVPGEQAGGRGNHTAEPSLSHGQRDQLRPSARSTPLTPPADDGRGVQHAAMASAGHAAGHHDQSISPPEGDTAVDGDAMAQPRSRPAKHAAVFRDPHPPHGTTTGAHAMGDMGHGAHGDDARGGAERARPEMEHGAHAMAGMEHDGQDMGGMDHGLHMAGGFMSMVAMTQDLPRSRDGLPMEWIEVPFGPLFPGLPGGLALVLTLDGDVVARAALAPDAVARGLAAAFPGPVATFPDRLARLDPLTPIAYRLLAWRALESAAGGPGDADTARAWVGALERERACDHLGWLASFAELLGDRWLAERAAAAQRALLHATDPSAVARLRDDARRLDDRTGRDPFLRRRLRGIGRAEGVVTVERSGPVARAAGHQTDARAAEPAYQSLGFAPVTRTGDDALARLHVRLAEVVQSLELVLATGATTTAIPVGMPRGAMGEHGMATVETPRGTATLHLRLDADTVREAHLDTPSTAHGGLVAAVAEGREVADALVGVASLDLSPWERDR